MIQKWTVRIFYVLVIIGSFDNYASSQVQMYVANQPDSPVQSGGVLTLSIGVTNSSTDTLTLTSAYDIPQPLRVILRSNDITLNPGSYRIILVPIYIPRHSRAGSYELEFHLDEADSTRHSVSCKFLIPRRTEISVKLISPPKYVRADDTIRAQFVIANLGNDDERVTIYSSHCRIGNDRSFVLKADSVRIVDAELIPDKHLDHVEDRAIGLSCTILSNNQMVSDQSVVRIYPVKVPKTDPYLRFPIAVNANYVLSKSNGVKTFETYQYQITGNGFLDAASKHHLVLEYRGPGSVRITRLGNFSQKYAQYYNPKISVFVGQKTFGLSRLTEFYRFGTGVDFRANIARGLQAGTYYNLPIFQPEIKRQLAGFLQYTSRKKNQFRINAIRQELRTGKFVDLTSLQSQFTSAKHWNLNTELALSAGEKEAGMGETEIGSAFSYEGALNYGKFNFASNGLYAGKSFKGYYNNSIFLTANSSYNLKKVGFQVGGSYSDERPNLDTVYSTAPYAIFLNTALTGRFSRALNMQFMALYRQKIDRLNTKRFDYQEKRLRLTANFRRTIWSIRILSEAGYTTNLLVKELERQDAFGYDAQMQFNYHPKGKLKANVFGQFLSNTRFTNSASQYLFFGAMVNYEMHRKLKLELQFQNNYLIEELYNDRNILNFRLDYQVANNQNLSILTNYGILHQAPIRRDWYFQSSYTFKIGVPIKKLLSLGRVEGIVQNLGVESVHKIVLLLDGQFATTDAEGKFHFENVRPGEHELRIDGKTIGVRDIPITPMPLKLQVVADEETRVVIPMVRSASVKGRVDLKKADVIQSSKEVTALPRIIIEITNGVDRHLTQTDGNGNFVFGSLRPGVWSVQMVSDHWKDQFAIRKGQIDLELSPDSRTDVTFLIEPKVRQIKFLSPSVIKIGTE